MSLTQDQLLAFYRTMLEIRGFEEHVDNFFQRGMIHGTTHLYIGEEASAVGVCGALHDDDLITSTHRGHGHCIAKGIDLSRMMAELMGRATGYCKGKGGSMHIADLGRGNLGANGIVAGGIPIATGAGLALKMQGHKRVVACFFGDGASNEGAFHEAVNMAAIWKLPVLFVCENNQYGMSGSVERMSGNPAIEERALAYDIPGVVVDGQDVTAVYQAATAAVARARKGDGPTLLHVRTYRYKGHSKSDANRYRTREEIETWRQRDPILKLKEQLLAGGVAKELLSAMENDVKARLTAAVDFALNSPDPDPADLLTDVYAPVREEDQHA